MEELNSILEKISLIFGVDSVEVSVPEDLAFDLSLYALSEINKNDLDNEIVMQSKLYMLFSALQSYAADKFNKYDAYVKQLESKLSLHYEQKLISSKDRVSDKKIEKLVESDERMMEAVALKLKYKNMVNTFTNILEGLSNRSDMLIQLVSKRKEEMKQRMI